MKFKVFLSVAIFILPAFISCLFSQDTVQAKIIFGIRFNANYDFQVKRDNNFRIIHVTPLFSVKYKHHNIYFGPQFSYIFQLVPPNNIIYEQHTRGLNIGYRYYSSELVKNLRLFGQLNYAIFQIKYKEYQLGPPYTTYIKETKVENTISLGVDYSIIKKFHLFTGLGFGSYHAIFLVLDNLTLTSCLGMEYYF